MGQFIYDSEARLDKDGNLTAYASEEGKEYGGLNELYDPAEVKKIDELVKAGKHAEAKQYAIRTYITKTQSVADQMAAIGLRSAPIEYTLRDIYFNMGGGGMASVIRKATGSNAAPYKAIADFMTTHTQADLLQALFNARAQHYADIITSNPNKAKYRTGWNNRNRAVLNNALELLQF